MAFYGDYPLNSCVRATRLFACLVLVYSLFRVRLIPPISDGSAVGSRGYYTLPTRLLFERAA